MILEDQIRAKIADYLREQLTVEDLEDWLADASRDMHLDSAPGAIALATTVDLALAAYSDDAIAQSELKQQLSIALSLIDARAGQLDRAKIRRPVFKVASLSLQVSARLALP